MEQRSKDVHGKLLAELCRTQELCGEKNKAVILGQSKTKQSEVIKNNPFKQIQKQTNNVIWRSKRQRLPRK